jgi:hypothetical protein
VATNLAAGINHFKNRILYGGLGNRFNTATNKIFEGWDTLIVQGINGTMFVQ